MKEIEIDLAKYVKDVREKLNLTQLQLAEVMSCTKGNVSAWEKRRHEPSYSQLLKLSEISGLPLPHDKSSEILMQYGIEIKKFDMEEADLVKTALKVPAEDRGQAKTILATFDKKDNKKDREQNN